MEQVYKLRKMKKLAVIYHNTNYSLLLGKRILQSLKFHVNSFSYFGTSASLF